MNIRFFKSKHEKTNSLRKKLQNECEDLWKQCVHKRDGEGCQVKKHFPQIFINHSGVYQIDHCFSRSIKELFIDVVNGTKICSTCNQIKGSGKIGASKKDAITVAVHEIVKKREGEDSYKRLLEIASSQATFLEWKNIAWLEEQKKILESMIQT